METEHDLIKRLIAQAPRGAKGFNHAVKGNVLVLISLKSDLAHLSKQLPPREVPGEIDAEDQIIHQHPNQAVRFFQPAVRNARTDAQIRLPGEAMQQNRE